MASLVNRLWKTWGLPHYISAFSLVPGGGSIYFDVEESRQRELSSSKTSVYCTTYICRGVELTEAESNELKTQIQNKMSSMLWLGSRQPERPEIIFHEVRPEQHSDAQVPDQKMTQQQQQQQQQVPQEKCSPGEEGRQADHQELNRQIYVVEVRVMEYKHGVVFRDHEGPLVYEVPRGPQEPVEARDSQELAEARDSQELAEARDSQELAGARGSQELAGARDSQELAGARGSQEATEARDSQELAEARDSQELAGARGSQEATDARNSWEPAKVNVDNWLQAVNDFLEKKNLGSFSPLRRQNLP